MDIYFDYNSPTEVVTNSNAIDNSIKNIILTRIGSLPGKPDFGSDVLDCVFELMGGNIGTEILKNSILRAIIKWEPRIHILDIRIKEIPEYNRVIATIEYEYIMLGKNLSHSVNINLSD